MTDSDDLRRLVVVAEAIEDAGGELVDVDVRKRKTAVSSLSPFSSATTESTTVLDLTVSVEDVPADAEETDARGVALQKVPADEVPGKVAGDEECGWDD